MVEIRKPHLSFLLAAILSFTLQSPSSVALAADVARESYVYKGAIIGIKDAGLISEPGPVTTDSAGNIYALDLGTHRVQKFSSDGEFLTSWGSYGSGLGQFNSLWDIALDSEGNVYVVDRGNNRIQVFSGSGQFLRAWGLPGVSSGLLALPTAIKIRGSRAFVSDSKGIQEFNLAGALVKTVTPLSYKLGEIRDFDMNSKGQIFIIHSQKPQVTELDKTGKIVKTFEPNKLSDATDASQSANSIFVNQADDVYVSSNVWGGLYQFSSELKLKNSIPYPAEFRRSFRASEGTSQGRIIVTGERGAGYFVLDTSGKLTLRVGTPSNIPGSFLHPEVISIDKHGNVYLYSDDEGYIRKFDAMGTYLMSIGNGPYPWLGEQGPGKLGYLLDVSFDKAENVYALENESISVFSKTGEFLKTIPLSFETVGNPEKMALDSAGNIYITDSDDHELVKLSSSGEVVNSIGGYGESNGKFSRPRGIVIDASDTLYVSDTENYRVQKFDSSLNYLGQWTSRADELKELDNYIGDLAIDAAGNIYASSYPSLNERGDMKDSRLLKFSSSGVIISRWLTNGSGEMQIGTFPSDIAVSKEGLVYAPDENSASVKIYQKSTNLIPLPTISGSPEVGKTLEAEPGAWPDASSIAYSWLRDGQPISGATSKSLTLVQADLGRRISLKVTASYSNKADGTSTSNPTLNVLPKQISVTQPPTLTGKSQPGELLTLVPGKWSTGVVLSYNWFRDNEYIEDATSKTYKVMGSDYGKTIMAVVTGTLLGEASTYAPSFTRITTKGKFKISTPKIMGTPKVARKLYVLAPVVESGSKVSYIWSRNSKPIANASGSSYVVTAKDKGQSLTVKVLVSKAGYSNLSLTAAKVKIS